MVFQHCVHLFSRELWVYFCEVQQEIMYRRLNFLARRVRLGVHYNTRLWEILIFLQLFLNVLLQLMLLFNNQLVFISLHHISVKF